MKRSLTKPVRSYLTIATLLASGCGAFDDTRSVQNLSPGIDLPTIESPAPGTGGGIDFGEQPLGGALGKNDESPLETGTNDNPERGNAGGAAGEEVGLLGDGGSLEGDELSDPTPSAGSPGTSR